MTYTESAALMTDLEFRGRIKTAVVKYASSIEIEAANAAHHHARIRWASNAKQQPDTVAGQVQPGVVMDPAVQSAGAAIDDTALQGAVEAEANTSWI